MLEGYWGRKAGRVLMSAVDLSCAWNGLVKMFMSRSLHHGCVHGLQSATHCGFVHAPSES